MKEQQQFNLWCPIGKASTDATIKYKFKNFFVPAKLVIAQVHLQSWNANELYCKNHGQIMKKPITVHFPNLPTVSPTST